MSGRRITDETGVMAQTLIPETSAHNIAAAPGLYRAGFFADVSAMTLGVLSSVLLYTLLKAVSWGLALTVLVLDVISNAVSISGSILLFAPLVILQGDGYLSVLTAAQLSSPALLSIKLYESAYAISLGLFSGSCLLTGYLKPSAYCWPSPASATC
jgi:hypothetical protein